VEFFYFFNIFTSLEDGGKKEKGKTNLLRSVSSWVLKTTRTRNMNKK